MDFKQLVCEARTCRRFDEVQRLGAENLSYLVDCARVAPSARNAQVLRYILVHTEAVCESLFPFTRWGGALKDWGGPFPGERPTGYVAMLTPKDPGRFVLMDVGIAAQTMQLAATERGWGVCMIGAFDAPQCEKILGIPEDMSIALILGVGAAVEVRKLAQMPESGSFTYWRDENQVHYVPKRGMDELVLKTL